MARARENESADRRGRNADRADYRYSVNRKAVVGEPVRQIFLIRTKKIAHVEFHLGLCSLARGTLRMVN